VSTDLRRWVAGALAGALLASAAACGGATPSGPTANAAAYAIANGSDVLLVERQGHTTLTATRPPWRVDSPHRLASGTKSFAGVAAIAAVQDGYLTLDEPAADLLGEWRADPAKSRITVRELLNQSSGIDPQGGLPARDVYRAAIASPLLHDPGTIFDYGPDHFNAFAALLQRALRDHGFHGDALAYLRTRVLDPIGVHIAGWDRDGLGQPLFASGSDFSAEQWVRFGRLVAQHGRWGHRRILRATLVDEMLDPSAANPRYGLGWWLDPGPEPDDDDGRVHPGPIPGAPADLVMAAGAGDQRLYVIPSRGLVVVRFGEEERFQDRAFLTRLFPTTRRGSGS
jgi:CubicO group peptidase (beta-lactamase class C family)